MPAEIFSYLRDVDNQDKLEENIKEIINQK